MIDLSALLQSIASVELTPIVLALVLGGAIGLERELHGRPAGIRTHMLVCLCSTVLMLASKLVPTLQAQQTTSLVFDPQRLAAGIVTGIGFLGAAAVIRAGDIVRGLTTGACVWCVAGLGVVIGQGAYGLAIVAAAAYLFILIVLDQLPISGVVYRRLRVRGSTNRLDQVSTSVLGVLRAHRLRVQELTGRSADEDDQFELGFHVRCRSRMNTPMVLEELRKIEDVGWVDWTPTLR